MIYFEGSLYDHLSLIEFSYNNSYHSSILWHLLKIFMVEDVDFWYDGLNLVSPHFLVQIVSLSL